MLINWQNHSCGSTLQKYLDRTCELRCQFVDSTHLHGFQLHYPNTTHRLAPPAEREGQQLYVLDGHLLSSVFYRNSLDDRSQLGDISLVQIRFACPCLKTLLGCRVADRPDYMKYTGSQCWISLKTRLHSINTKNHNSYNRWVLASPLLDGTIRHTRLSILVSARRSIDI